MNPKLLIIDDDEEIRTQMKWALNADYEVHLAEDRLSALELFREYRPQVVLLDLGLPPHPGTPEEGLATLSEILAQDSSVKVIIVSGQGEKDNALQAIGAGAYDFLTKPAELEELKVILKRTFHVAGLEREFKQLQKRLTSDSFEEMLGTSSQMQSVFSLIRKVATTDAPVLVLGESGTGKEMVSLAIHRRSTRKEGAFVAINCSAIPETLLESELFGHERGAFTGAHVQRKGRIESANGGTLFLDEIGELPPPIQVKLLRFLQEQRIERVGGRQEIQVDTRVISATHVDLKKAIVSGRFREDLYYRLAVVVVNLPPLCKRENDIHMIAQELLRRYSTEIGKNGLSFEQEAIKAMNRYSWPGNVREMQNRVKRAVIMAEKKRITTADLELESAPASNTPSASVLKEAREALEREMVLASLQKHSGKITPAAADLGISRPTFYELMDKLKIDRTGRELKTGL
ncbi:MAG: PEP-CTERM-box response regulator transcription factor [Verrucomicrobiota bacterium]